MRRWYNKKYLRSGSLFGNRYKSNPVEKDNYLLSLVRYIHQNPIKAGLVDELEKYLWSSYNEYIRKSYSKNVNVTYISAKQYNKGFKRTRKIFY